MSVYLKPCTGCPLRAGCEQRDEFRRRVAGLGLRSATFNCERLKRALTPGTRVSIAQPITVETSGYSGEPCIDVVREVVPATIINGGRDDFSCVVDRDALLAAIQKHEGDEEKIDTYRFRKTMQARRIVNFLDEPRRLLCGCGHVRLLDGSCDKRQTEDCFELSTPSAGNAGGRETP